MIIYNVTIKLQAGIHSPWLAWMQQEHIPAVVATGCFENAKLLRLLDIDDEEGPTYAVQYFAAARADYDRYIEKFAAEMREESFRKWGDSFIAFRSIMEVVN